MARRRTAPAPAPVTNYVVFGVLNSAAVTFDAGDCCGYGVAYVRAAAALGDGFEITGYRLTHG